MRFLQQHILIVQEIYSYDDTRWTAPHVANGKQPQHGASSLPFGLKYTGTGTVATLGFSKWDQANEEREISRLRTALARVSFTFTVLVE